MLAYEILFAGEMLGLRDAPLGGKGCLLMGMAWLIVAFD